MKSTLEMAREAGFISHGDSFYTNYRYGDCKLELERFAALVRADEREACAKVCENIDDYDENVDTYYSDTYANAIRARSNT